MDNNIKNIFLDWGGVLIDLDKQSSLQAFRKLGLQDADAAQDKFIGILQDYELGNISTVEFRQNICKVIGKYIPNADIDHAWNSMLLTVPTDKLQLILELKQSHSVYLLSNTNHMHWEYAAQRVFRLDDYRLDDFFDGVFLSYEMHKAKPDKSIFQIAVARAGLKAEECLFVDDLKENCDAAIAAGLHAIQYTPGHNLRNIFK